MLLCTGTWRMAQNQQSYAPGGRYACGNKIPWTGRRLGRAGRPVLLQGGPRGPRRSMQTSAAPWKSSRRGPGHGYLCSQQLGQLEAR